MKLALSLLLLLALSSCVAFVAATKEDVAAEAAARRAAKDPEELAREIATNTVVDADLLPTRPPPKTYSPSGEPEFALFLSPGRGKGCNLKKFPLMAQFLREEAKYYPDLVVDYALAADPKIKFYATREQRDAALIHGELLTEDDIFALLAAGPDQTKEPLLSVELGEHDWESAELRYLLSQHKVIRAEQPNEDHSAMLIWKKGFKPVPA